MRWWFLHPVRFPARLHFQETPWDLAAVIVYTIAVGALLLALGVGDILAIGLILVAPGYVLVAALFPTATEFDWIERLVLSVGVSIVIVALIGLLLALSDVGLTFLSVNLTIVAFTVVVGIAAYLRRLRVPSNERLAANLIVGLPKWKGEAAVDKVLTLAIAGSIVAATGALAYALLSPPIGERFTEFYLLGPSGNATGYPTNLSVAQRATVIIGLANHEGKTVNYSIRVDLVGIVIVHNATSGYNVTVELNRTTWTWFNTTLKDGTSWTEPFTFSILAAGEWEVQLLLLKNGILTTDELHLILRVT